MGDELPKLDVLHSDMPPAKEEHLPGVDLEDLRPIERNPAKSLYVPVVDFDAFSHRRPDWVMVVLQLDSVGDVGRAGEVMEHLVVVIEAPSLSVGAIFGEVDIPFEADGFDVLRERVSAFIRSSSTMVSSSPVGSRGARKFE